MRILSVGNMYPPHHFGGYELVWRSAVEHLRARGHDVRVLTTDTRTDTVQPDGPAVHRELRWALRGGEFAPQSVRERVAMARHNHAVLQAHLDSFAPDLVTWWSMGGLSLTMIEAVRRRGLPAVAFVHDEWLDYGRWSDGWLRMFDGPGRRRLAGLAERLAGIPAAVDFGAAAEYVFVSEFTRGRARQVGVGLEHTSVAHSGIHDDFLSPAPPKPWDWRLLYVGRLDPRKGVDVAIEALAQLPSEARLTIAGGWDEREEERLHALARTAGVADRVTFAGQCERDRLMELYAWSDAVVFPVRWDEPWGLVPIEAMARGRPVLASGRGGSAEYLRHGDNCLLFDADDGASLVAAVRRLAEDDALRERLVAGGLATAPQHTEAIFNAAVESAVERASTGEYQSGPPPLRVLHVGTGFRPWRRGGLVAYVEGLLDEQVRRGIDVTYLFAGRFYPFLRTPRLRRWRRGGVPMLEIVNSPLHDHGRQPALEVSDARMDALVASALAEVDPDIVHVHELAGLPTSVLDLFHAAGVPTVLTLQDYFALCPTFKLLDAQGAVCLRRDVGEACRATVGADDRDPALLYDATLRHDLASSRLLRRVAGERRHAIIERVARLGSARPRRRSQTDDRSPAAYQRRRELNVERLNRVDRLVAMSTRVAEIHAELGVDADRMVVQQLTLPHISRLRPRRMQAGSPLVFATLGGGESQAKGAGVLLDAARSLGDLATAGRFRLLLFGHVAPPVAALARTVPGVELAGAYAPHEQDALLDGVDVGIVPSIWEEAYAYAGVEFLAKAIPVIANAIGGMSDYVHPGTTGWLNHSRSAEGLAAIMRGIVEDPSAAIAMNAWLREHRAEIILSIDDHQDCVDRLYAETAIEHRARSAAAPPGSIAGAEHCALGA